MTRDKYYQSQGPEQTAISADQDCFPPFFEAVLTPYRSMPKSGLAWLLAVTAAMAAVSAAFMAAVGLWFAPLLFLLPVGALWLAFHSNFKAAQAYEHVRVSPFHIHVTQVSGRGHQTEVQVNLLHTRLVVRRLEDEGVTHIFLVAGNQRVSVGSFLNPADRTSFADAFVAAIQTAKSDGLAVYSRNAI